MKRALALFILTSLAACGGGESNKSVSASITSATSQSVPRTYAQRAIPSRMAAAPANAFSGNRGDYTITASAGGYTVTKTGDSTTLPLTTQSIQFADMTVNTKVADSARTISTTDLQSIIELYIAYFNRVPDADGLDYWISQLKGGLNLDQIGSSFYSAATQYSSLTGYTASMTNSDFVIKIYNNVLGRTPDADGLKYWTDSLAHGSETRGTLIRSILNSAHTFKGDTAWGYVADLLDNKVKVAALFAVQQGLNYNTPEDSIKNTTALLASVTSSDVAAAVQKLGNVDWSFNQATTLQTVAPPVEKTLSTCNVDGYMDLSARVGKYVLNNNVWNPANAKSYSECVEATINDLVGVKTAKFQWSFESDVFDVKSFPEILVGQRILTQSSTTSALPKNVSALERLTATGTVVTTCANDCKYDTGFDLFFQSDATRQTTWSPSTELMVITDTNWMNDPNIYMQPSIGMATFNGVRYKIINFLAGNPTVSAKVNFIQYIALTPTTSVNLDLKQILDDALARGLFKNTEYLFTVEFGTEVVWGSGTTAITNYSLSIN